MDRINGLRALRSFRSPWLPATGWRRGAAQREVGGAKPRHQRGHSSILEVYAGGVRLDPGRPPRLRPFAASPSTPSGPFRAPPAAMGRSRLVDSAPVPVPFTGYTSHGHGAQVGCV